MSVMNKPDYKIFAQDAKSGEYVAFPDILRGWGITLEQYGGFPPMELFNSAAKRIDEWLMYLTQRGLPEWDAAVDYPKDAMIQHAGIYYVSLKATKGEQPNNSQASWKKLTEFLGVDGKLAKDQNGADIPDKDAFIKNLGLGGAAKSNVVQGAGSSQTDVMSQKAVTDLAATKQAKGNYASGDIFQIIPGYTFMHSPEKKYRSVIGDDGIFRVIDNTNPLNPTTFSFGADGAMTSGTIPAVRITGLFSRCLAVSGARAIGTKYTNSRLTPMAVAINFSFTAGDNQVFIDDGVSVTRLFDVGKSDATTRINIFFIVPPGAKYWVEGNIPFTTWSECY